MTFKTCNLVMTGFKSESAFIDWLVIGTDYSLNDRLFHEEETRQELIDSFLNR